MQCPKCNYEPTMAEMQSSPDDCVQCGVNYEGYARHQASAAEQEQARRAKEANAPAPHVQKALMGNKGATPVIIIDFEMSFLSMVKFMVKWVIASIPAAIILVLLATMAAAFVSGVGEYSKYRELAAERKTVPKGFRLDLPKTFPGEYYVLDSRLSGSLAFATIKSEQAGRARYSRVFIQCAQAWYGVSAESDTYGGLDSATVDYQFEAIPPVSLYRYVGRYVCQNSSQKHELMR